MGWINGTALAVMLKPMFPALFARVDEMEADGTLDRIQATATTLANNGTLEKMVELAAKLDRHNELLERIANELALERTEIERLALVGPGSDNGGPVLPDGAGMSQPDGAA